MEYIGRSNGDGKLGMLETQIRYFIWYLTVQN